METIHTPSSFRSRIVRNAINHVHSTPAPDSTILDDPFAGEDELWAPEDWATEPWAAEGWAHVPDTDADSHVRFFAGLVSGLVLSALVWLGIFVTALAVYELLS